MRIFGRSDPAMVEIRDRGNGHMVYEEGDEERGPTFRATRPIGDGPPAIRAAEPQPPTAQPDSLIAALIEKLPPCGEEWDVDHRLAWLRLMVQAFELNYG